MKRAVLQPVPLACLQAACVSRERTAEGRLLEAGRQPPRGHADSHVVSDDRALPVPGARAPLDPRARTLSTHLRRCRTATAGPRCQTLTASGRCHAGRSRA